MTRSFTVHCCRIARDWRESISSVLAALGLPEVWTGESGEQRGALSETGKVPRRYKLAYVVEGVPSWLPCTRRIITPIFSSPPCHRHTSVSKLEIKPSYPSLTAVHLSLLMYYRAHKHKLVIVCHSCEVETRLNYRWGHWKTNASFEKLVIKLSLDCFKFLLLCRSHLSNIFIITSHRIRDDTIMR